MCKRICFFTNSMFRIGGEQRITTSIVNELVKNNYDVTIIIKCKEKIDYSLYGLSKKVHLIFLNMNYDFRLNNITFFDKLRIVNRKTGIFKNRKRIIRHFFCSNKLLNKLKKIFVNNEYDVVIGVAGDRSFILSYLKEYIGGKIIFWNHMNFDAHFKNKNSRYYNEDIFIEPLIKKFDNIINLNEDDVVKFKKYYNVNSEVIYNCKSFNSNIKSNLNNYKFVSCGRLVEQKGFEKLIEIMKLFVAKNKDYKLDIYGSGELKEILLNKINEYKLNEYINIYSESKNIEKIFPKYDLYLNTSIYEGFGLTTLEALECGLPVFGFDIPANRSLIQDNKTGRLIKCYDTKKYANILLNTIDNKKILKYYQSNIEENIKKYDISEIIKKWIIVIEK